MMITLLLGGANVYAHEGHPTITPKSNHTGGATFSETLRLGSRGRAVRDLQSALMSYVGNYPPNFVSGYFDRMTETAVKRFQSKYNIVKSGSPSTTGYGMVGLRTNALLRALSDPQRSRFQ